MKKKIDSQILTELKKARRVYKSLEFAIEAVEQAQLMESRQARAKKETDRLELVHKEKLAEVERDIAAHTERLHRVKKQADEIEEANKARHERIEAAHKEHVRKLAAERKAAEEALAKAKAAHENEYVSLRRRKEQLEGERRKLAAEKQRLENSISYIRGEFSKLDERVETRVGK